MKVTIIPRDAVVAVDGVAIQGIDMSTLDPELHAVQWYGEAGEEEYSDPATSKMLRNVVITSLDAYSAQLQEYMQKRLVLDAEQQEAQAEQTIVEV